MRRWVWGCAGLAICGGCQTVDRTAWFAGYGPCQPPAVSSVVQSVQSTYAPVCAPACAPVCDTTADPPLVQPRPVVVPGPFTPALGLDPATLSPPESRTLGHPAVPPLSTPGATASPFVPPLAAPSAAAAPTLLSPQFDEGGDEDSAHAASPLIDVVPPGAIRPRPYPSTSPSASAERFKNSYIPALAEERDDDAESAAAQPVQSTESKPQAGGAHSADRPSTPPATAPAAQPDSRLKSLIRQPAMPKQVPAVRPLPQAPILVPPAGRN